MKPLISLLVFIVLSLTAGDIYGQQTSDELNKGQQKKEQKEEEHEHAKNLKQQHAYYKKTLEADSVLAEKVVEIQANYKAELGVIAEDSGLSEEEKRAKIQALIDDKNRKLEAILTPEQQALVIPTTEREKRNNEAVTE